MIKVLRIFLVVGIVKSDIMDSPETDEEFGGFVRNMFSKVFSAWPFNVLDGIDHLMPISVNEPIEVGLEKNSSASSAVDRHKITWYPLDMEKICKEKTEEEDICGKKSISIRRICKQMENGAEVKAYCSSLNKSDENASFRISIRYVKALELTAKNASSLTTNTSTSITNTSKPAKKEHVVEQKFIGPSDTQKTHYRSGFPHGVISDLSESDKDKEIDPKILAKRDVNYDTKVDKNSLKTGYSMSMYGIAMSSGALGTVLIVLVIVITYSVVRVIRIRNTQKKIERAKSERKKVLRLQKLSSLISEDSEIDEDVDK